ncbi:MAG: hypothetical protein ACM3ZF_13240 [Mycobacterium leprae]
MSDADGGIAGVDGEALGSGGEEAPPDVENAASDPATRDFTPPRKATTTATVAPIKTGESLTSTRLGAGRRSSRKEKHAPIVIVKNARMSNLVVAPKEFRAVAITVPTAISIVMKGAQSLT